MTRLRRPETALKSYVFRRERERTWRTLENLVNVADSKGPQNLTAEELSRLATLYRATLSSLSVARSISLDRNVVDYLEGLAARAYFVVYGPKRTAREAVRDFFARRFPRAVRGLPWHVTLAASFLLLGTFTGLVLTLQDPDRFYAFVSEDYAAGRGPTASTAELRAVLYDDGGATGGGLSSFSSFLLTHNAQIGLMAFALGFLAGVPVFLQLFSFGLLIGSFGALYQSRGLALEFWAWVLPHGTFELSAIVLAGAGGLVLAESLVFPGRHTRIENLRLRGREAGVLALGAVAMFSVAALIEGFFRQLVQSVSVRYAVTAVGAALIVAYFARAGRERAA